MFVWFKFVSGMVALFQYSIYGNDRTSKNGNGQIMSTARLLFNN